MPKMKEMQHTVHEKFQNEKEHIMDHLESPKRPSPFLAEILFCTVWFVLQGIKGMVDTDVFYIISAYKPVRYDAWDANRHPELGVLRHDRMGETELGNSRPVYPDNSYDRRSVSGGPEPGRKDCD